MKSSYTDHINWFKIMIGAITLNLKILRMSREEANYKLTKRSRLYR